MTCVNWWKPSLYYDLGHRQLELLRKTAEFWNDFGPLLREQEELAGGVQWKTVKGREYLIRHWNDPVSRKKLSKSLGPRNADNERIYETYTARRDRLQRRLEQSGYYLDEIAKGAKALNISRVPFLASRVCRQLHARGLGQGEVLLVNEASKYAYEAHFGVAFDDFPSLDLVLHDGIMPVDAWADLLVTSADFDIEQDNLSDAILRSVRGMERNTAMTFVASPASGPLVVTAYTPDRLLDLIDDRSRPGADVLDAIEWALNEPVVRSVAIGYDGAPVPVWAPDPRALIFTSYAMASTRNRNADRLRAVALDLATLWARGNDEPFLSEHIELFPELAELHAGEGVIRPRM